MKYLIDLTMLFEVDTGKIVLIGEEESSIKLSNQASRLLYELIIHSGQMLERDGLIKKVWEDRGCSGSSVSLNVAISEIRKAFKNLGRDPMLIQTVRGKGFSLTAHIEHHTVRPKLALPSTVEPMEFNREHSNDEGESERNNSRKGRKIAVTLSLLFILTCALSVALFLYSPQSINLLTESRNVSPHYVGNIDRCHTYLIEKKRYQSDHYYLMLAKQQLALQNINCKDESVDIYFAFFIKNDLKNYFLGACYPNKITKEYNNCVSYRRLTGG